MKENEEFYEDDFFINLTIDGMTDELEVKVNDPSRPLSEQVRSILKVFDCPKVDAGGNPITYLLGLKREDEEEPDILELEDEDGNPLSLEDHNVQSGDHLSLISVPIAG